MTVVTDEPLVRNYHIFAQFDAIRKSIGFLHCFTYSKWLGQVDSAILHMLEILGIYTLRMLFEGILNRLMWKSR